MASKGRGVGAGAVGAYQLFPLYSLALGRVCAAMGDAMAARVTMIVTRCMMNEVEAPMWIGNVRVKKW